MRKGDLIVEVETDKSTVEVEAPGDGILRVLVAEGATVPVDTVLARLHAEGATEAPVAAATPTAAGFAGGPRPSSPAARRLARERGIAIDAVAGTGPDGRVVAADVALAGAAPGPSAVVADLRSLVVASLSHSWQTVPHIHIAGELDATGLAGAKRAAAAGTTVTDLLVVAVARALRDVPDLNGTVDAAGTPHRAAHIDLAIAVATPSGVVAPVIRHADTLGLAQVAAERARLVAAARAGVLDKRDLGGATCTLSNLGGHPVDFFAPVITAPQVALVATGRMAQRPVAIDGMLAVRERIWVNAAIDHRGADGEAGGRFLAALERRLAELPASI